LTFNPPTISCDINTEYRHVMDVSLFYFDGDMQLIHSQRSFYLEPSQNIESIQEKIINFYAVFNGSYFGKVGIRTSNVSRNASPFIKSSITQRFTVINNFTMEDKDGRVESQVIANLKKFVLSIKSTRIICKKIHLILSGISSTSSLSTVPQC
jgi:hypothetical protein